MIVTLTPNPSLDRALHLERLEPGEVNRAVATHQHPGGKGINVSRALAAHGVASRAVLPSGGPDGAELVALLAAQGVDARPVPVAGDTRSNITLTESSGATTKINAPGAALAPAEVDALLAAVEAEVTVGADAVVAAGSLPAGLDDAFFTRVADLGARHGVPVVLDTSGAPFAAAVRHGGLALVKPNDEELADLVGQDLTTVGDVLDAARSVRALGTDAVLVSLGAHGALLVADGGSWWAGGPALVPVSTVGAGDSTLAGYLAAAGAPADRLRRAVAWGRAAVLLPGSAVPRPSDIRTTEVAVVADPDPALALKEL
ncbi:1-phosphofructokinase [Cellulomonas hominis]|uniref:1-phosphofructokinase n=1 Tax=Cellulomonas hominis TaxID=156981 RepID=UPI001B938D6E|nr:1-phosphofructokinase [Cellulomonas hominis]VTR77922.1 ATP-dependent 6-phosphofructokinase isozyme 2 [Cellulomonas hominis]